ncbi:DUF1642 domain-containing protein [Lactococcus lactis]|jgi:hypothetical protein|uniref:DUF1642 domain-containing protein n=1 Tax=Lactococcus lactis TaxID=1358 RepID=UPI001BAB5812|nr:DUF1642 domain-containing protein [Lactococcus lactis]MCH5427718.1 DUF1642 domain-containing protein [Lactococcus lactis]MDM7536971.1 DUF1642 domain-containing protein [Lactococcus lactis]MDN5611543.1 DUF1642 domain-containing protein [Staphylococcus equorum]
MTKFEEEFKALTSWDWINIDLIQRILTRFGNWHSDEEFQEMKESYWNQAESILSMLDEIKSLRSQLQQQSLPVVPECVAEFVSGDENELSKADRIAYLLKSVEGDNYYLEEYLTNAGIIFQEQGEHLYAWATNQTHETILKLWNGFTVEKPQLFYLRDELTGQFLAKDNQFKDKDRYFFWTGADPLTHSIGTAWKLSFTQQEIDSMQTGSYELVPVEDGE